MFNAILIALLVLLSGIIAYVGDWLGSYVGKKRLSLFGTRPKQTGKIIGIGAGIAIMLVTLGISFLAFRNAWNVIFAAQRTYEQVGVLEAQERSLRSRVNTLEGKINDLETLNARLSETNTELSKTNTELFEATQQLNTEVISKTAEVTMLNERVRSLTEELNAQARKLEAFNSQLDARGELTYRDAELINSTIIESQNSNDIGAELATFVQETNNLTAQRGAGAVALTTEQFTYLVEATLSTSESDVVILRSENNQFSTAPLAVTIEAFENRKVFAAGQLLVSLPVILPEQAQIREIRNEVIKLWLMARNKLINASVIESVSPDTFTESSSTEGFTNQLLRLNKKGKIRIGLIVSKDIYVSGPAQLELVILN